MKRLGKRNIFVITAVFFLSVVSFNSSSFFLADAGTADDVYGGVLLNHPRIFITSSNAGRLRDKIKWPLSSIYTLMVKRVNHRSMPKRLSSLKDYVYKCGYLYQMTKDLKWADYVIAAMEQVPESVKAYGGAHNGYAHALETLAIGFDWCYPSIVAKGKRDYFVSLINEYFEGNKENLAGLPEFHNYASQAQFAMLAAGLATYGDNSFASEYIDLARDYMERGKERAGQFYKVLESINYVDGTCSWEGPTYARQQLFSYGKYAEALRTATAGKINPWQEGFSLLKNAGYYIIYSLRPDSKFENLGDVSYPALSYYDINNLAMLQGYFKDGYFTSFLDKYYRWSGGKFAKGIWLGSARAPLVYYLLWYDPGVEKKNLEDLPKTRKFADVVIMRTGFSEGDTFISFKSGIHWGFHSQLDHGSFTIYKNAPLAIDSGYYDSWSRGKPHNWNYWKRTIAHNSLLIYDPDEKWPSYPKGNKCKNDGGQRMAFRTFFPPHIKSGMTNKPLSIEYLNKHLDDFLMGRITAYKFSNIYDYIKADISSAYNNKYSGWGNNQPRKVKLVEREFVFLKPKFVAVFDKVESLNPAFAKSWLLHSGSFYDKSGKPRLSGSERIVEGNSQAGIAESNDTDLVTIVQGKAKLFVKTVLPLRRVVRRVGGAGYEFWVHGDNFSISRKSIPKKRRAEDPGAWRIEIKPEKQNKQDMFLNILHPCDGTVSAMPDIEKVDESSKKMAGVHIKDKDKNWVVMFRDFSRKPPDEIRYRVGLTAGCRTLICGLRPNAYYKVSFKEFKDVYEVTINESRDNQGLFSSDEGIVSFVVPVRGLGQ